MSIPASVPEGILSTWKPWAVLPSEVTVTSHHHNSNKANELINEMQTLDAIGEVCKGGDAVPA